MVTAKTVKGLAERLQRAEQLVREGAVYPVAGLAGYAVVRNGDGTQMYFVRFESGHEHCTCADFQQRQQAAGLPCKHILSAELALGVTPPAPVAPAVSIDAVEQEALAVNAATSAAANALDELGLFLISSGTMGRAA